MPKRDVPEALVFPESYFLLYYIYHLTGVHAFACVFSNTLSQFDIHSNSHVALSVLLCHSLGSLTLKHTLESYSLQSYNVLTLHGTLISDMEIKLIAIT